MEWISPESTPDGGSVYDARNPRYVSSNAYVVDDVLVAHLDFGRTARPFSARVDDHPALLNSTTGVTPHARAG